MSVTPINVYSIPELRQTLDADISSELNRLNFKEVFTYVDMKLVIGYSIGMVAGTSFIIDKNFDYKETINYQKLLVLFYVILSGAFWWLTNIFQKNVIYTGENVKEECKVVIRSHFENNNPIYILVIEKTNTKTGKVETINANLPVNKVFNEAGYLQKSLYFEWLKDQLEMSAKKDL
ncbi:hypothetical protein TPHA_0B01800 [Tetrapisispora phaffii CBS 4417]|uniref:Signal peptidase complex subunit 2 n=1 Tax=Tetrapisispora phaffii (strain ATCC 24235 / CBS 4417 / NBRC 1672 / NRRL Y-8282 / UCD 70-5) TaxID=1071381 RepID=G8BPC2_TETPH|nr:hypothetical protein TPHA_0B01800 [Tetrapisispora phaffii CBS 4417]CCE61853.1 hypothetical protein TPHA_0B01800 [Tetrapisispora phaffii CBS 4417]